MIILNHQVTENNSKIQKILSDIDAYQQAIDDAQNALATAEQELNEELDSEMNDQ